MSNAAKLSEDVENRYKPTTLYDLFIRLISYETYNYHPYALQENETQTKRKVLVKGFKM
jgi:hypothetical protein